MKLSVHVVCLGASACFLFAGTPDHADFTETVFASDPARLASPTRLAWAPDGSNRLFVTRYHGQVQIIEDGELRPVPFLEMKPIYANGECGLLGLCFDPDYAVNRYVYFFVSVLRSEQQIIRYRDEGNVGVERTTIVQGLPTVGNIHNGGGIAIGADGKLYWGIGDNGEKLGVNDDLISLAAKIGRANLDGSVPNDNPFNDGDGPNNDYIWARGVRNPWALVFQPGTGRLWVNVVGNAYEQVFVLGSGDHAGYDLYERNQPAGFVRPVIRYRTNRTDRRSIRSLVRAGNVLTVTTSDSHLLYQGEKLAISEVAGDGFNGSIYVSAIPSPTTLTAIQNGPDAIAEGGRLETLNQGGCITGGAFYTGSTFPAEFRGNYFYGDYNSGRILRATLDGANQVASVDYFVSGVSQAIDVAVGPDGALYYTGHNKQGAIFRLAHDSDPGMETPTLIVQPAALTLDEGDSVTFSVHLSHAPVAPVSVHVSRVTGSDNIRVTQGELLQFGAENATIPQPVTVRVDERFEGENSNGAISISADGLEPRQILISARDVPNPELILSTTSLEIGEGADAAFTVHLSAPTLVEQTVKVSFASGDSDFTIVEGQSLSFTPGNYSVPQTVRLKAVEDTDLTSDAAVIRIEALGVPVRTLNALAIDNDPVAPQADLPPVAIITKPVEGEVVSGNAAEFFGDGLDDVGTVKAEFYIDGRLEYTDINDENHFHYLGEHQKWDTTQLADGPHQLKLIVYDGRGQSSEQSILVVVNNATTINQPPIVSIEHPSASWFFVAPAEVLILSAVSDPDGMILEVQFFNGPELLGSVTTPPFQFLWTRVPAGQYSISAVARDDQGALAASEPVAFSVIANPGLEADVAPRPKGTGTGPIHVSDWVQVGRLAAGLDEPASVEEFLRADCFPRSVEGLLTLGDGVLDVDDWRQAGRYVLGLDPLTVTGGPGPRALVTGTEAPARARRFGLEQRTVRLVSESARAGPTNRMTVELGARGDENAFAFSIRFDPTTMEAIDVRAGSFPVGSSVFLETARLANGRFSFGVALPAGQALERGAVILAEMDYRVFESSDRELTSVVFDALPVAQGCDALSNLLPITFVNGEIAVEPMDGWPRAVGDAVAVLQQSATAIPVSSVIGNDLSTEDSPLRLLHVLTGNTRGALRVENSNIYYTPPELEAVEEDAFDYVVIDELGRTDAARVTVKLEAVPLPRELRAQLNGDQKLELQFLGNLGLSYAVEVSPDLIRWERLGIASALPGGHFQFVDPIHASETARFYRVTGTTVATGGVPGR